ncbi:hypothetical protein J3998_10805 [Thiomicrorhabdus sp. 6S2-11]|uniref:Outer membrane protein beta-barrel domain-containing protein n=1 Tax=Thiomicrorhabdus marina TaxID=2818442 RepID=A0ABS3Q6U8_9GAMM|nr:hypothetical protein [Thiomicrorhabdus marina]MBO1928065.1 hypothetical protein [Thiomicrorhabdus marina]
MLRKLHTTILLSSLSLNVSYVKADDFFSINPPKNPFSIGVGFGAVEGLMFESSVRVNKKLNLRFQHAQGLKYKKYDRYEEFDYRYYTDGSMTSFIFDFHPLENGFFLSAGYVRNNFKVKGDSMIPEGTTRNLGTLNLIGIPLISANATATNDLTLDAKVRWKEFGPRIATGWLFEFNDHFSLRMEVGALIFGDPELSIVTNGEVDGTDVNQIDAVNEERDEQQDNFDGEADKYDLLPIFNFGMNYRF